VALPSAFDHSPLDQRKALHQGCGESHEVSSIFFLIDSIHRNCDCWSGHDFQRWLGLGYPLTGAALAGVVGGGMVVVVANCMRNSENQHAATGN
jgi:hypothetical protein